MAYVSRDLVMAEGVGLVGMVGCDGCNSVNVSGCSVCRYTGSVLREEVRINARGYSGWVQAWA